MDNNPSFSLSLFLPINREGSGHENASAGIEQNVRGRKRKCSAGNSFHVGLFVPLRRRPWNPSLYRADHGHSHLGQTELYAILSWIAFRKVWPHFGFPGRKRSSFIQDIRCWSQKDLIPWALADVFHLRSLVAFPKVTAFVDFRKALKQAGLIVLLIEEDCVCI